MSNPLESEIQKRRTFAIISHPDAGKTTITEKLLLFGGAIQQAGAVKAKRAATYTTSDWMELEKQRGVSVSTSVMCFDYQNHIINLLDTPGHADFSEDTYRTLTAVDSVLMVIDSTKGVESRTKKLMDVCQLRKIPVITFINKLDREGRNSFELLDDIEKSLQIQATPLTWPISMGKTFKGVCNIATKTFLSFKPRSDKLEKNEILSMQELSTFIDNNMFKQLTDDLEIIDGALDPFDIDKYLKGEMTPVFFGSAINNFGVQEFLDHLVKFAPPPQARPAKERTVNPHESKMTGIIFKIHANMDPKHRDRIAFLRICSGTFIRSGKYKNIRLERDCKITNPITFLAQERTIVEKAYPGDIIGIHDTGLIKIGDTFTEGETINFTGIPRFAPEIFRRIINKEPMKSKQLQKGLQQLMEEGVVQLFKTVGDNQLIIGAVGMLQLDVVKFRLQNEYNALCDYESCDTGFAYWIKTEDNTLLESLKNKYPSKTAYDIDNKLVFLFQGSWQLSHVQELYPKIDFYKTSECNPRDILKPK